jgi:hypothetical protein
MGQMSQALPEPLNTRMRRFAVGLTIGFIIGGNALLLLALWMSGIDLDRAFGDQDLFDPARDVCLRMAWYRPLGEPAPVRLCKEWINLKDASGHVHQFEKDVPITKGQDGKFYMHPSKTADGRIIVLLIATVLIVAVGMAAQRYVLARYRARLIRAHTL